MMPVIRISDATYAHLQRHAKPFEDTPESIIIKALTALDMMTGEAPPPPSPESKRNDGPKLPQKEFRVPLLVTLLSLGGSASAKAVREKLEPLMAHRLSEGDYESVSTGDPRWWNAVCWERSDLVREGLMREDSPRGIWEISESGKSTPASLHRTEGDTDRLIAHGTLYDMAERFWRRSAGPRPFIMVGETVFKEAKPLNRLLLKRVEEFELSMRSSICLKTAGIIYLGDLVRQTETDLLRTPNFGRKSLNEIKELLAQVGLTIGMEEPGWPPENLEALATKYAAEMESKDT